MEENVPYGQRVREVFPQADLVIDSGDKIHSMEILSRFFRGLFGDHTVSPTRDEFFHNVAFNVSLTSCDTARQVGAAIEFEGEILATGFNEAPKAGGGTYWAEEGYDARDVSIGEDINTIRKRQMVVEILEVLRDRKELKGALNNLSIPELEKRYLDEPKAPLKESQIMDSLEYGRAVHAEMAAITFAARTGKRIKGATLFCTTFPCHNCAKHIVASGIECVVYMEPFPKSFVTELYPDSIAIDRVTAEENQIVFEQFLGITPKRYGELFKKKQSKDARGYVIDWIPTQSSPILKNLIAQEHPEREVLFSKEIEKTLSKKQKLVLGLIEGG